MDLSAFPLIKATELHGIRYNISGRLRYANAAIISKGIKLFGQKIQYTTQTTSIGSEAVYVVDNAYIHMALSWGGIIFLLFIITYMLLIANLIKKERYDLVLMSLFFVIIGFGETYMYNVFYNLPLLYIMGVPNQVMVEYRKKAVIRKRQIKFKGSTVKHGDF